MQNQDRVRIIRSRMMLAGMTQVALAKTLGLSRQTVQRTIRGKKSSPKVLKALRRLGVPEKYLIKEPASETKHRAMLKKANITLTALAQMAGVSRQVATDTVDGKVNNGKVLQKLNAIFVDMKRKEEAQNG